MDVSVKLIDFLHRKEGAPLTCYLDPVGIPTIYAGFTMRSPTVKRELAKIGITKLIPGKTKLTKAQGDVILAAVLRDEFEPSVEKGIPAGRKVEQHMFDAMVSATYNLGPKFMTWSWKKPWADKNDIKGSADIWAVSYNTAGGKKLPGLVTRRKEEARMFYKGDYGTGSITKVATATAPKSPDPVVKEAQENLNKVGIPVDSDGWMGPKTEEAIKRYQALHPDLKVDGQLGVATITQLSKDVKALKSVAKDSGIVTGVTTAISAGAGLPWGWIAAGVAVVAVVYFSWRYRDVLKCRLNRILGREACKE